MQTRTLLILDEDVDHGGEFFTAPLVGEYAQDVYDVAFRDATEVQGTIAVKEVTFLVVKDNDDEKQIEEMLVIRRVEDNGTESFAVDITDDSRFLVDAHGASFHRL